MADNDSYILAIDQGTTGTTCLVVSMGNSTSAQVIGRGYSEFPQYFPQPGWVEHDLIEIWNATILAIRRAIDDANLEPKNIAAIGITNQRETTGIWDNEGTPVHRAIVWQDRRTATYCQKMISAGYEEIVRERTGLVIDPYFSGTKVAWLLDELNGLRKRAEKNELKFGTIDTWLIYKLTQAKVHVTDVTNASRTMLFDINKGIWDKELCKIVGNIPENLLPQVCSSSEIYGKTKGVDGLPDGIPIAGIAGDQQAALFGQACFKPGMVKCTYGTGAFALLNTGSKPVKSKHQLLTTIAWKIGNTTTYTLEGSSFVAGAIVQWLRDGLGFIKDSSEIEALAKQVPDSGGVILVPALTGLGAPHWQPQARGLISGLTRGTTRAHIARAALEGIALQTYDLIGAMEQDSGNEVKILRVDGGATANNLLMHFQADILNVEIHRPAVLDTTAMGAAFLAGLGIGIFSNLDEVANSWALERAFKPSPKSESIQEHIARWHDAVKKT